MTESTTGLKVRAVQWTGAGSSLTVHWSDGSRSSRTPSRVEAHLMAELDKAQGTVPPEEKPTLEGLEKFMERAGDLHETRMVVTWANLLQWSSSPLGPTK